MTFRPGLGTAPGAGTLLTHGGRLDCTGTLAGQRITRDGTIELIGRHEGRCGQFTGHGAATLQIPTEPGAELTTTGTFRLDAAGLSGTLHLLTSVGRARGPFVLTPLAGTCASSEAISDARMTVPDLVFHD